MASKLPICVECRVAFKVAKNGVTVRDPKVAGWSPTFNQADLMVCPDCGVEILTGFGEDYTADDGAEWTAGALLYFPDLRSRDRGEDDDAIGGCK
jgi:hypothetical protein